MNDDQAILLVDDSENDVSLMRFAFKKAEFTARLFDVGNGEEAIAYLKGDGRYADRQRFPMPVLMLLDLNMPMRNGFDVLTWVRSHPELRRLSMTIMTASTRVEDIERAFDLGANAYLVKPSTLEELSSMIRSLRDWVGINHFPPLTGAVKG